MVELLSSKNLNILPAKSTLSVRQMWLSSECDYFTAVIMTIASADK